MDRKWYVFPDHFPLASDIIHPRGMIPIGMSPVSVDRLRELAANGEILPITAICRDLDRSCRDYFYSSECELVGTIPGIAFENCALSPEEISDFTAIFAEHKANEEKMKDLYEKKNIYDGLQKKIGVLVHEKSRLGLLRFFKRREINAELAKLVREALTLGQNIDELAELDVEMLEDKENLNVSKYCNIRLLMVKKKLCVDELVTKILGNGLKIYSYSEEEFESELSEFAVYRTKSWRNAERNARRVCYDISALCLYNKVKKSKLPTMIKRDKYNAMLSNKYKELLTASLNKRAQELQKNWRKRSVH